MDHADFNFWRIVDRLDLEDEFCDDMWEGIQDDAFVFAMVYAERAATADAHC